MLYKLLLGGRRSSLELLSVSPLVELRGSGGERTLYCIPDEVE
jgi:hypothetical protein